MLPSEADLGADKTRFVLPGLIEGVAVINFDTDLDRQRSTSTATHRSRTPRSRPEKQKHSYMAAKPGGWDWEALRDYVASSILRTHGPFERNFMKEKAIFSRFIRTFGPDVAERIARHTFEVQGGWHEGSPVGINKFCKGSDPFYAIPVAKKMGIDLTDPLSMDSL